MITIDDVKKVEIKIGEIISVETIEGSDKLLKLKVNFGTEERQVLSGIKAYFPDPQALLGKRCPFVTNLAPRVMMGLESQAMILARSEERQVLSGIKAYFPDPQALLGKRCPFVTNLAPRVMMGLESQAMILAAGGADTPFALFETTGTPGDTVK